jgi:hypothetical protein
MPKFTKDARNKKRDKKNHDMKRDHEHKKRDHGQDMPDAVEEHHEGSAA